MRNQGRIDWFTGAVTELPPLPSDPAALKGWVELLSEDQVASLAQQIVGGGLARSLGRYAELPLRNPQIELPPPPEQPSLLTLTIELRGTKPRIWRRLALPGDLTLDVVHTVFQAAMGWSDSHLHRFLPGTGSGYSGPYFCTESDEEEGDEGTREEGVRLDQVLRAPGDRLTYLYDFGDGWEHRVTLESVAPLPQDGREPTCLGGARACPPEDVGGVHGHQEIAVWLRAGAPEDQVPGSFDDADHALNWLPAGYDPDAFDAAAATQLMRGWVIAAHLPGDGLPEPLSELVQGLHGQGWVQVQSWLSSLGSRQPVDLSNDDVAHASRPWLAVLNAVGSGTKLTAAGYLPPRLVEQIAQASGVMERWIGKARREDLTWPVAALREAAQEFGLLRKSKGTLTPTVRARAVAADPRALVAAVLERLPLGKGVQAEAGWFALLGLAAGQPRADLDAALAQILTDRGWRTEGTQPVAAREAGRSARATTDRLEAMAGGPFQLDEALLARLARAAVLGVADSH